MFAILAIPRLALRIVVGTCIWLMFRPGGWAVACVVALLATEYYADFF
ncbi:hypothetical protein [Celeribacter marinus]|uniref:Uncharacterized protein n=1 Tax=Celeribacter marinus TaxID=1397108 RepID=A0A0N9ZEY6_9RHOB|nr:hypothetical protein [Celeribacter marinus]ALI55482.1 hypothetical protein IMCC12053_1535 [Celeribacter marinus]SFK20351.1 hypothetical protein SAMN05444421_10288 [Celeribacter marinus]